MFAMNNKKYRLVTGAALAILCGFGGLTMPAAADETRTEAVSLRGLDLNTQRDQLLLRHRLLVASMHVCTAAGETAMIGNDGFDECRNQAFKNAWAKAEPMIAEAQTRARLAAAGKPHWAEPGALVASAAQR